MGSSKAQSWQAMTPGTRLYIATIVAMGSLILVYGGLHWASHQPIRFCAYLLLAVGASRLKVNLPGITGTMSVNFLFILLSILELSLAETLAVGVAAILMQCLHRGRPRLVQVLFNVCATSIAIGASFCVYHLALFNIHYNNPAILLVGTACMYFVANTVPVAAVIALTEEKSLKSVWEEAYFWSFPYYLVG